MSYSLKIKVVFVIISLMIETEAVRINESITSIDEVEARIIDPFRKTILSIDWVQLGVSKDKVRSQLNFLPLVLYQGNLDLPLGVINGEGDYGKLFLQMLPPYHLKEVKPGSGYFWVMFEDLIEPNEAQRTHDFLCVKGLEIIIAMNDLDPEQVINHILTDRPHRAWRRLLERVTEEEALDTFS